MFKDYNKMKREMAFLELQLQSFTGLSVDDMITSMTFTGEPEGDRVQSVGGKGDPYFLGC